ncbi:MAG: PIG-L family deacetylase [Opitutae bacterium]|nr:PIG-L family deacetylase [Opitutae bacterium]
MPSALAIAAHPDDIEFTMAGTLLLLKRRGWAIHYFNLATGSCGSTRLRAAELRRMRLREARRAAAILGARFHPPIAEDMEILYDLALLRRVSAVVRAVRPSIVLTHSPQDYMEDHMNACRLAVSAAFVRGMPNFVTTPRRPPAEGDVAVYHAMPHGLRDGLRRRIVPGMFVNTTAVHATKLAALAARRSQQAWLDTSQGMSSYLRAMAETSRELGRMSRRFRYAEGWRRHLHLGYAAREIDPLRDALGPDCITKPRR